MNMHNITFAQPAITKPDNLSNIADQDLDYLLDYARRTHHDLLKALHDNKAELLKLGREKARREGIMFPPSFETILHPTPNRKAS